MLAELCAGLQGLLQIDHIYQLSAVLDDGVVVMIGEEAGDQVRANAEEGKPEVEILPGYGAHLGLKLLTERHGKAGQRV